MRGCLPTLWKWLGRAVALAAVLTALATVALAWALSAVGERNLTLAFFLYLPRVLFLLPALCLLPAALLWRRWISAVALVGAGAFFFVSAMGYRGGTPPPRESAVPGETITVLTYNRGQHMGQSLQPFKNLVEPDVIVLQESGNRAALYAVAEGYELFEHGIDVGEFTVLSRYPILSAERLDAKGAGESLPPAARIELDFAGRPVALYAIHPLSPRGVLLYYRRGAFLHGILGLPGTPFESRRLQNQVYWDNRIADAEALLQRILDDPLPTLVAGDLNAPAGGFVHRLFREALEDAHEAAGRGFGYTFPGTTRNPLSGGGPWMRIDYLFCDRETWETRWCLTEEERPSQHRAVAAQFRLREAQ